jgi:hypothetical protein
MEIVLSELDDTGPGVDGVSVGSLTQLHFETREWMLDFFNHIWQTGNLPESWSQIRVVLHYKGKGSDPYCADNYRGLGIGAALEKILSLMMMKRLEIFLQATDALHLSQGGFLSQRGPPEQVFTLSESVRAELKAGGASASPVHLCFIDIERAYDSVQHVKLWARCAEMGIGGRFLATLQAMYAGKKAVLDVNGELLEAQDIQCGVLQGNPLSPLLFNIYIDPVLRNLDAFAETLGTSPYDDFVPVAGVRLPVFDRKGEEQQPPDRPPPDLVDDLDDSDIDDGEVLGDARRQVLSDILTSLFFADDGVLIARTRVAMQQLIDFLVQALDDVCLLLNARKTKVMIVPRLSANDTVYTSFKKAVAADGGYQARGRPIEVVDEFMYLGVCLWYGWDWTKAWHCARQRARRMLYCLRQSGFQNRPAPLIYQLRYAASQVLSHLDYVAALTGVEGSGECQMDENEVIVNDLLRFVTGCPLPTCVEALRAESGTWDFKTRVRMLQLRFFTKLTMMDCRSTHFRALCLSKQCSNILRVSGGMRYFTWFDGVMSSAAYFDIPTHDPARFDDVVHLPYTSSSLQPVQTLVRFERQDAAGVGWQTVAPEDGDLPDQCIRVRAVHDGALRFDYSTGETVTEWLFPTGTSIQFAMSSWSPQLREAVFAELRLRGNIHRQLLFRDTLNSWAINSSGQRDFAPLKEAVYLEPYWFADDPIAARCILRSRIGQTKLEFHYRRVDHRFPRASASSQLEAVSLGNHSSDRRTIMHAVSQPWERACYLCPLASWMPETVSHTLLMCPHAQLSSERDRVKIALVELAQTASDLPDCPLSPSFDDPCTLYFVLQLATSVGPSDHQPPLPADASRRSARLQERQSAVVRPDELLDSLRQQNQWMPVQRARAQTAVLWTAFLTSRWRRAIAREAEWEPAARAGARLVNLVANFHRRIVSLRRRVLQKDASFLRRGRDPARPAPDPTVRQPVRTRRRRVSRNNL